MEYLDFDTFKEYGGSGVSEEQYARYEMKARRLIDNMTRKRLAGETTVRECVKMCMYELICAMLAYEMQAGADGREIASVSNDGVSVSYVSGSGGIERRFALIVRSWLDGESDANGVPLLYAGV